MERVMKGLKTAVLMALCCAALPKTHVVAQQAEVRQAIVESLAAWRAADFQRLGTFYDARVRGYMLDGGMLLTGYNAEALQAAVDAGFSFSLEPQDIDILILNPTVAVAVAIVEGTITVPGGETQEGSWRYSETRVKDGSVWKVVQYHFSPLEQAEF
jgi:ketosteroid isomerase-like protein